MQLLHVQVQQQQPCTCTCSSAAALHLHTCSSLALREWAAADCVALCCSSSMQWLMIQTEFLAQVASTHPPTLYSRLQCIQIHFSSLDKYILHFRQIHFVHPHTTHPHSTLKLNALARPQRRALGRWGLAEQCNWLENVQQRFPPQCKVHPVRNTFSSLEKYILHFRQIQIDWWVYIAKVSTEQRALGERSLAVHSLGQSASAFEALQCICSLMMWSFLFSECTLCRCAFWYFLVLVGTFFFGTRREGAFSFRSGLSAAVYCHTALMIKTLILWWSRSALSCICPLLSSWRALSRKI